MEDRRDEHFTGEGYVSPRLDEQGGGRGIDYEALAVCVVILVYVSVMLVLVYDMVLLNLKIGFKVVRDSSPSPIPTLCGADSWRLIIESSSRHTTTVDGSRSGYSSSITSRHTAVGGASGSSTVSAFSTKKQLFVIVVLFSTSSLGDLPEMDIRIDGDLVVHVIREAPSMEVQGK
ncbi:hypothetical protein Vadar_012942 [Vaccinium darrowii]|uniref:Uncharacterized protein n=1 Tax=Vaccinium darrowii TaxID=229202 RepID=A0ACB7XH65_9ERIC|nr:hypothetical protein Vadar_012942 [Vaccinium darrowii]